MDASAEPAVDSPPTVPRPVVWVLRLVLPMIGLVVVSVLPAPVWVISPSTAEDLSKRFEITGTPTTPINGRYLSLSVSLRRMPVFLTVAAALNGDEIVGLDDFAGFDDREEAITSSVDHIFANRLAAAAAARIAGLPVGIDGSGVRVTRVLDGGPAAGILRKGDVVRAANAQPVRLDADLAAVIASTPNGRVVELDVDRDGRRERLSVEPHPGLFAGDPAPAIGIVAVTEDLRIDLPFTIAFDEAGDTSGPSHGVAMALAIADALSPVDVAAGRTIAATGEIGAAGEVLAIGSPEMKARAARREGAAVMVVPAGQGSGARSQRLQTIEASRLADVISELTAMAADSRS